MPAFDPGPDAQFSAIFGSLPDHRLYREHMWYEWGPIFYRGRLDGSARVICVGSDPGPTERVAGRTLVGDAGQRVQGFLAKIGITRSYVCVNAIAYAFRPGHSAAARQLIPDPVHTVWRKRVLDALDNSGVQAIIAFGVNAWQAVEVWKPGDARLVAIPHPTSRNAQSLLNSWRSAVDRLRQIVTPDPGALPYPANYGANFRERDYSRVPREDLPFGVPAWLGDDAWVRAAGKRSSVRRRGDLTLIWSAPPSQP